MNIIDPGGDPQADDTAVAAVKGMAGDIRHVHVHVLYPVYPGHNGGECHRSHDYPRKLGGEAKEAYILDL
jgi:hypothetical protein